MARMFEPESSNHSANLPHSSNILQNISDGLDLNADQEFHHNVVFVLVVAGGTVVAVVVVVVVVTPQLNATDKHSHGIRCNGIGRIKSAPDSRSDRKNRLISVSA